MTETSVSIIESEGLILPKHHAMEVKLSMFKSQYQI